MAYSDFTSSRSTVAALDTDAMFSTFLMEACTRIHALGYFYRTGPKIREEQAIQCPSCIVIPRSIDIIETQLSGMRFQNDYILDIGFALKGSNDCILLQQALYYEQIIRKSFAKGDDGAAILTFDSIPEHFNTKILTTTIEPVELLTNDVLAFSSGINIAFSTWESY